MDYVKYTRTFVMLEEQIPDFAASKAPIKGYLKVETGNNKGALRCVVQNLKYFSRGEYTYKLILFGKNRSRVLNTVLGGLAINRHGNGETYFRFNPLDMDGKGNQYVDFSVAVVAAVSGSSDNEALQPVLKGIMKGKDEKIEEGLIASAIARQEEEKEEEAKEEVKEEAKGKDAKRNFHSFYNEYLLQFCGYTCRSANFYEDVFPFEKDLTGANWKRIQNVASLPLISPGAHFFATQYKHFLFGARPDSKGVASRYFFAVPGRFIQEEQPDGGRSGFVYWQPVSGMSSGGEIDNATDPAYGYWILAVDAFTGDIIEAG